MSYGSAKRRDARRQTALTTLARKERAYKDLLANKAEAAKPNGRNPKLTNGTVWQNKLDTTRETIKNTQANMGKGTAAMK